MSAADARRGAALGVLLGGLAALAWSTAMPAGIVATKLVVFTAPTAAVDADTYALLIEDEQAVSAARTRAKVAAAAELRALPRGAALRIEATSIRRSDAVAVVEAAVDLVEQGRAELTEVGRTTTRPARDLIPLALVAVSGLLGGLLGARRPSRTPDGAIAVGAHGDDRLLRAAALLPRGTTVLLSAEAQLAERTGRAAASCLRECGITAAAVSLVSGLAPPPGAQRTFVTADASDLRALMVARDSGLPLVLVAERRGAGLRQLEEESRRMGLQTEVWLVGRDAQPTRGGADMCAVTEPQRAWSPPAGDSEPDPILVDAQRRAEPTPEPRPES